MFSHPCYIGLSQGGNLAETCQLATLKSPLANTHKKNLRKDGVGYTKSLHIRKILRKTQISYNRLKTKRVLKLKYKREGGKFLYLACQGSDSPLWPSISFATAVHQHETIWLVTKLRAYHGLLEYVYGSLWEYVLTVKVYF